MRHYFAIGPSPHEEECAMVGEPGYRQKAIEECTRFIRLLREMFGPEPEGAWLRVQWSPHDFGDYCEVVCSFDTDFSDAVAYAHRCDDEAPATWGATPQEPLKTCPTCGGILEVLLF